MENIRLSVKVKVVLEMVEWINRNIQSDITSEQVTRQSGYTHWHFQKLFSTFTGYTLAEYIRLRRILSVAEALFKTHHKVTHISFDHGFPTQQSLARLFRRYFGVTPSEFRRAIRDNPACYSEWLERVEAQSLACCDCLEGAEHQDHPKEDTASDN